ncbi:MAG: DUF465 domain-containing protein [Dissulfurispiraceae bacterium]|jgi:uncharacterized protein YdcH (DUF465 family)|nr:DUF465 domain-containing protein [Dissulfurispiraceae bacterium]
MKEEEIVELLRGQNEDFRKLYQEHRDLDMYLTEMAKKQFLSSEEEYEVKRLHKEKVYKKDKIAAVIREYKREHAVSSYTY